MRERALQKCAYTFHRASFSLVVGLAFSKLTERTGIAARLGEGIDNEDKEEEDRAERTSAARRGRKGKGKYDELTKSSEVQTNNVQ